MAIGVSPETYLASDSGLEIGETGAILVDQNFKTNDDNIYAVGDAIEVFHLITGKKNKISFGRSRTKAS